MKILFISLFIFLSCNPEKKSDHESIKKEIHYVNFKRNPAQEYFFTRKYKLSDSELSFYSNSGLVKMSKKNFFIAKKVIDSLPKKKIDKKIIGHTTVEVDIPDWTLEIYYNTNDTIFIASGGLPDNMKAYRDIVWEVASYLDQENKQ